MKKTRPTGPSIGKALPDRAINITELSELTGLSTCALYHLRSHRPSALPPPLTGDAYRNSAMYLLSTTLDWLRRQQAASSGTPVPAAALAPSPESSPEPSVAGERRGRPRK
jgi:hypothetical protein